MWFKCSTKFQTQLKETLLSDSSDLRDTCSSTDDELNDTKAAVSVPELTENWDNNDEEKKTKKKCLFPPEIKDNPKLQKYWRKRYSLFHKFDHGIKLDEG